MNLLLYKMDLTTEVITEWLKENNYKFYHENDNYITIFITQTITANITTNQQPKDCIKIFKNITIKTNNADDNRNNFVHTDAYILSITDKKFFTKLKGILNGDPKWDA